jgi:CRISPR-associated protein Csd2
MSEAIHTNPDVRHDFVLLFDVCDGNPNGDPDAGNLPRVDPETMHGLVTDVCLKRKVRNYVLMSQPQNGEVATLDIYVKEGGVLNRAHRAAYEANDIPVTEPKVETLPPDLVPSFLPEGVAVALPDGFSLEQGEADEAWSLRYSGELDKDGQKEALAAIEEQLGKKAKDLCARPVRGAKSRKAKPEQVLSAQETMCARHYDIRAFGAVLSTNINCGQVRGPLQLTFARSIDPVVPLDLSITRVAVTREEDAGKERGMGRKALVPYGLYRGYGFFNPYFARKTKFSRDDLALFWKALQQAWDLDRSAARGLMALRGLYVFSHDSGLGSAPAHELFDRIVVRRRDGVDAPRRFTDYEVLVNRRAQPNGATEESPLPEGVSLIRLVG